MHTQDMDHVLWGPSGMRQLLVPCDIGLFTLTQQH